MQQGTLLVTTEIPAGQQQQSPFLFLLPALLDSVFFFKQWRSAPECLSKARLRAHPEKGIPRRLPASSPGPSSPGVPLLGSLPNGSCPVGAPGGGGGRWSHGGILFGSRMVDPSVTHWRLMFGAFQDPGNPGGGCSQECLLLVPTDKSIVSFSQKEKKKRHGCPCSGHVLSRLHTANTLFVRPPLKHLNLCKMLQHVCWLGPIEQTIWFPF